MNVVPTETDKSSSVDHVVASFPIVGIVASAGGLGAFKKFFNAMPADSGMAFVLIPHLDPDHASLMVELLSNSTSMPIVEAKQGMTVEVNCVYIIPPKNFLAISKGLLQLSEPPKLRGWQTSIDFFLRSLAQDQGERAIGIVLSGTGSHGALGVREIKLAGGMVMAQEPDTAEYDQMPKNAIATGLIDCVLPPDKMPAALVNYVEQPYLSSAGKIATPSEESSDLLNQVLTLLQSRTKYDFRSYRKAMVLRRIQRRMGLAHIDSITHYLDLLQQRPEEVTALYKDLLISVTAFFRDPEAYQVLEQEIIPALVARQTGESPIRVWVPGCATGEEAYSIAMLLFERVAAGDTVKIQIFASDLDEDAIEVARVGIYPASVAGDVSPDRLKRFFVRVDDNHYRINKQLREAIIFSHQNLIGDAPFSKLDLISCRNLLIYLEPEMQQKVISLFHFALVTDGYLLLGPTETIARAIDLFETVSKKWRVYRRIGPVRHDLVTIPLVRTEERPNTLPNNLPSALPRKSFKELTEKLVLNEYAPATALINRRYEILYVTGPLVNYLEFPMGELTKELLAMARAGLRTKLRAACNDAIRDSKTVFDPDARVKRDGKYVRCSITVRPLTEPKEAEGLMLVMFQDESKTVVSTVPNNGDNGSTLIEPAVSQAEDSRLVKQLEFELKSSSEELYSTIEEMESSNEELKTSNEEIMSMNEELQSANEELETSKEELQSLNEELSTVNSQLQDKVVELDKATDDLMNLMTSTEIATIFLDEQLNIKRFTPPTTSLLNLLASDVGRPLGDIAPKFADDTMLSECQQVLEKLIPVEREVQTEVSRYYLRRILPYRTTDHHIGGVVITFVDLTQRKQSEAMQRETDARFRKVFENAASGIAIADLAGNFEQCNPAYCTLIGYSESELRQTSYKSLLHPDDLAGNSAMLHRLLAGELPSYEIENRYVHKNGQTVWVRKFVSILRDEADKPKYLLALVTNTSDERKSVADLHEGAERMRAILNTALDAIITIDQQGKIDSLNPATETLFGYTRAELVGQNVSILMPPLYGNHHDGYIKRYVDTGEAHILGIGREVVARRKDGSTFSADLAISKVDHLGLFTGILRDISDRKRLQAHVLEIASDEQRRIGQELHDGTQQELTGLSLFAGALLELLDSAIRSETQNNVDWMLPEKDFLILKKTAGKLLQGLKEANQHVHKLSHGIMPVQIDAEGLRSALAELAAATNEQRQINCHFEISGTSEIPNNTIATQLYRIAQESLNNALQHGSADDIRISLSLKANQVILEICDNGVGIDPHLKHRLGTVGGGMGLRIMEYRANMLGGVLQVDRNIGPGTTVRCTVPATEVPK